MGIAEGFDTAMSWDVPKSKNLKWKTPIPGLGHSCPVVWGDRIFLTTAVSDKEKDSLKIGIYHEIAPVENDGPHTWILYCIEKKTGKVIWEKVCHKGVPKDKRHTKSSHANCTPATDGKRVVSFFGSEGLYCHDFNGSLLWKKDFGILDAAFFRVPRAQWGFASSPVIHEGVVLVQCDVMKNSFLAALDLETGKLIKKEMAKHDISSPVLVDGKILAYEINGSFLKLIETDPERFGEISKVKIGALKCTSPSPVGSKLLIRKSDRIACYELSVGQPAKP